MRLKDIKRFVNNTQKEINRFPSDTIDLFIIDEHEIPLFLFNGQFDYEYLTQLHFKVNSNILITKEIIDNKIEGRFSLEDKQLDDCFVLVDNTVQFSTPNYDVLLSSNCKENFLQLYSPKDKPIIAIEPMTGISNSFNNKIGLQELEANKTYALTWTLKLL